MPVYALGDSEPEIDPAAFVHPDGWIDSPMQAYLESARRYRAELRRIG